MASVMRSHDDVSALADIVDNLKISTLVNAAKITPFVQERTLGAKEISRPQKFQSPTEQQSYQNDVNTKKLASRDKICKSNENGLHRNSLGQKFNADVWHEVDVDAERNETSRDYLQLNDCKIISFRMAANSAEKQLRAKISSDLHQRQSQWNDELDQRLQKIRIESAEKQRRNHLKRLERERQVLQAIEQIEADAQQAELQSNLLKTEMIEHNRKLIERANKLKRQDEMRMLLETINTNKILFINLFEQFAKTIIIHQKLLSQMDKLAVYTAKRDSILERYEKLMNLINSKIITSAETDAFLDLCEYIKQEQAEVNADIQSFIKATESAVATANAEIIKVNSNAQNNEISNLDKGAAPATPSDANGISVTDGCVNANQRMLSSATAISKYVNKDRMIYYSVLINYYEEHSNIIQPLLDDVNAKRFRFNCQKAVNTPVNAISAVSAQHLQEKYDKLTQLISGNQVRVGDIQFSAAEHPLGIQYCVFLLAKKFVSQAATISTSSNPQSAFPIAAVIVSIWQSFPSFGKLFLALLYKECPFLVPFFIPPIQGQSEHEYKSLLGYRFSDDHQIEDQDQYLKRLSGIQRLYSAILITKLRRAQQGAAHPHGLQNGWIWLSNFLMLDPFPEICPTLLLDFLQVCGADMWHVYKKQFTKLLLVLHEQYMVKLDVIDSGGPNARLKVFLSSIIKENKIPSPVGTLAPNFW